LHALVGRPGQSNNYRVATATCALSTAANLFLFGRIVRENAHDFVVIIHFHDFRGHKIIDALIINCEAPHAHKDFVKMKFKLWIFSPNLSRNNSARLLFLSPCPWDHSAAL